MKYTINLINTPLEIGAKEIGLATAGATVSVVSFIPAGATEDTGSFFGMPQPKAPIDYYRVLGAVHPAEPSAPDINFEAGFPVQWNGKLLQLGGGGLDGFVPSALTRAPGAGPADPFPLERGYVVFGSDSGHAANLSNYWDCSWALIDEALENFAYAALKKVKDVVVYLAHLLYGEAPRKVYFAGGSNGGRECMKAIQKFPEDYDGAICFFPVLNWISKVLLDARNGDILQDIGEAGMINKETYSRIMKTIISICDGLDGAQDGVISNLTAAAARQNEVKAALSEFLSPEQMRMLEAFTSPLSLPFPLAYGEGTLTGYPVFEGTSVQSQFGTSAAARDAGQVAGADGVISCMIMKDANFDTRHFKSQEWQENVVEASRMLDANDSDLGAYREHGGKLILVHGMADQLVTVYSSIDYYNNLLDRFGEESLSSFVKFYVASGYGHGTGETFAISSDFLGVLDEWVESGKAPSTLVVTDSTPETAGRTRPLYEYPHYPLYGGTGDLDKAESFVPGLL